MTSIDPVKYYLFLAQTKENGENWIDKSDTNDDDIVTKSEFRTYLNKNKDKFTDLTGVSLNEDIINEFWNKIDTNRENINIKGSKLKELNAIAKGTEELEALNKNVELMSALEKFYKEVVLTECPREVLNDQRINSWPLLIKDLLIVRVRNYINNEETKDIYQVLNDEYKRIKNPTTASLCDDEYKLILKESVLKQYQEYNIYTDSILNDMIDKYIDTVSTSITDKEVYKGMTNLIDAYIATANLYRDEANKMSDEDMMKLIVQYGYDPADTSHINSLQKTVLGKTLNKNLFAEAASDPIFIKYESTLSPSLSAFINSVVESATFGQFDVLMKLGYSAFQETDEYKSIENNDGNDEDGNESEKFTINDDKLKSALKEALSYDETEAAKRLEWAVKYLNNIAVDEEAVRYINNNLVDFTNEGVINSDKAHKYVANAVKDLILSATVFGVDSTNTIEEIKKEYDDVQEDISHINDDTEACSRKLETYRTLAINLCKVIANKSDQRFLNAVREVYGSDYEAEIGKSSIECIKKNNDDLLSIVAGIESEIKDNENIKNSATTITNIITNIGIGDLSDEEAKRAKKFVPNFGVSANGSIEFQNEDAKKLFNAIIAALKNKIIIGYGGYDALINLFGNQNAMEIDRLVQAAWIMSCENCSDTIKKDDYNLFAESIFDNIESIFRKLQDNPELFELYTSHTAYSNDNLTNNVGFVGKIIEYKNWEYSDNEFKLENDVSSTWYKSAMATLLNNILKQYSYLNTNFVKETFIEAQKLALMIATDNKEDCPYGTGKKSGDANDSVKDDWGNSSRNNDSYKIEMDKLVQLTLYCFDKLIFKKAY